MHVITTETVAPTNTKDTRIKAKCWFKSIHVYWDFAKSGTRNHQGAAEQLVHEMNKVNGNGAKWIITSGGRLPDLSGCGFVIVRECGEDAGV